MAIASSCRGLRRAWGRFEGRIAVWRSASCISSSYHISFHLVTSVVHAVNTNHSSTYRPVCSPISRDMFSVPAILLRPLRVQSSRSTAATIITLADPLPRFNNTSPSTSRLRSIARLFSSFNHNMAPIQTKEYDYIVIGGGSGGSGAARRASGWYGKKTCIIDSGISGGCCVNVG